MYGNVISSGAKWIFFGFVGIVIIAILLGANIKEATWLTPNIPEAQTEHIQIESAHQQATYELQEHLSTAQTEADIQIVQRKQKILDVQYEHDTQKLNPDPVHQGLTFKLWKMIFMIFGGILSIAIIIGTILLESTKALASISFDPM